MSHSWAPTGHCKSFVSSFQTEKLTVFGPAQLDPMPFIKIHYKNKDYVFAWSALELLTLFTSLPRSQKANASVCRNRLKV